MFFTIEINHGGFFVGNGKNRSYVDGHVIYYDNVDSLTWSELMLEKIVEEIGYEMAGRMKVHYCIPMLTIARNGLREIRDEMDIKFMITLVDIGQHFFSLYLDHDQTFSPSKPSNNTQPELQSSKDSDSVASTPIQIVYPNIEEENEECVADRTSHGKRKRSNNEEVIEEAKVVSENDEDEFDSDFDCVDSDYDVSDDDDLHVDDESDEEKGKTMLST
jgi:hypothetical protein